MAPPSSKRRKGKAECIIHQSNVDSEDKFVPLSNVKGDPQEKLDYLLNICSYKITQASSSSAATKLEVISMNIPKTIDGLDLSLVGYHSECYRIFTKNTERSREQLNEFLSQTKAARSPRKSLPLSSQNLFPAECIFCAKLQRKIRGKTENCQTFPVFKENMKVKEESWRVIEPRAVEMGLNRLVRKVKGEDLFAKAAKYHKTCFKDFRLKYLNFLKAEDKVAGRPSGAQSDMGSAHEVAFSVIINELSKSVIQEKHLITLSDLRIAYVTELKNHDCSNADYHGKKLKSKLENCSLHRFLGFSQIEKCGCIVDYIIYNAKLSVSDAVAASYAFGYAHGSKPEKAAASLHDCITAEYAKSKPPPWPPNNK